MTTSKGIRFADNYVAENRGPGIWTDLAASEVEIVGNLVERNSRSGIEVEQLSVQPTPSPTRSGLHVANPHIGWA